MINSKDSNSKTTSSTSNGKAFWFQLMYLKNGRPAILKTFQLSLQEIEDMKLTLAEVQELDFMAVKSGEVKPNSKE